MKTLLWTPSPIAPCNNLYPIYFLLLGTSFVYIKSFSHYYRHWMMLLVLLLMMRFFLSFLLKLNSHYPYTFTSPFQKTLKLNQRASHNCYIAENMLKLLVFKWLLKELLLQTKLSDVMLIWRFVSIKLIRNFLKFYFLICFFKRFRL